MASKALDRILLWNHYVVPQWYYNKVRTARWNRFDHPDLMPKYGRAAFSYCLVVGRPKGHEGGVVSKQSSSHTPLSPETMRREYGDAIARNSRKHHKVIYDAIAAIRSS